MNLAAKLAVIFAGAGVGGCLRFWLSTWIQERASVAMPVGTLAVNGAGCLVMGLLLAGLQREAVPEGVRLAVGVGLLGGFTTASAFAAETLILFAEGRIVPALWNVLLTNAVCLGACALGFGAGRLVFPPG